MTITLTPEQETLVAARLEHGDYISAEHVAAEAFRLLAAKEAREVALGELRADIETGWAEAESGKLVDGHAAMSALLARASLRADAAQ